MAIALGIGGGLAAGYIASSAPVVKLIPSARNRALALAAVGAGASIYAVKAKIPMLLPVSVGVGIAAGVGAVQLLLAENKSASNTSVRKQNGVLARLTAAEVAEIRRKVSDTSYRLNGIRAGVITGRGNNMAAGVIVGGGDLPGMDRFS